MNHSAPGFLDVRRKARAAKLLREAADAIANAADALHLDGWKTDDLRKYVEDLQNRATHVNRESKS